MEKLTINVPESKSSLVKQFLSSLGIVIQKEEKSTGSSAYKRKLTKISTWSDDDFKTVGLGKEAFEQLKPQQW